MSYRSPWQSRAFVAMVAATRRLLRPWPRREARFVQGLVARQNRRVLGHLSGRPARSILLILPRCVKRTDCNHDVREGLAACRDCQRCQLGDLARLCERSGVSALVAFRSHIAFAMARERSPDLIIATACHDRLVKALRSVPEYPALLSPLTGMERMCVNAGVDLVWFERQLAAVTGARPAAATVPAPAFGRASAGS